MLNLASDLGIAVYNCNSSTWESEEGQENHKFKVSLGYKRTVYLRK
jgi:hypothetical protein